LFELPLAQRLQRRLGGCPVCGHVDRRDVLDDRLRCSAAAEQQQSEQRGEDWAGQLHDWAPGLRAAIAASDPVLRKVS
jgi:hypothetical protein